MHTDNSILPSSRKIKFIAASVPVFLLLYVLSIGPVVKLADNGWIGGPAKKILAVVYAPMMFLKFVPGADKLFGWYIFHVWNCDNMGDNTL